MFHVQIKFFKLNSRQLAPLSSFMTSDSQRVLISVSAVAMVSKCKHIYLQYFTVQGQKQSVKNKIRTHH